MNYKYHWSFFVYKRKGSKITFLNIGIKDEKNLTVIGYERKQSFKVQEQSIKA